MKIENAVVGLKVKVKNGFYIRELIGVEGTVLSVTSGGFITGGLDKYYSLSLKAPNSTLGFNAIHFQFLSIHLKKVK